MKAIIIHEKIPIDLVITEFDFLLVTSADLIRYMKVRDVLKTIPIIALLHIWESHEAALIKQEVTFRELTALFEHEDLPVVVGKALLGRSIGHNGDPHKSHAFQYEVQCWLGLFQAKELFYETYFDREWKFSRPNPIWRVFKGAWV